LNKTIKNNSMLNKQLRSSGQLVEQL